MLREKFDIKVQIKQDMLKGLVFGLNSRIAIGVVFGFVGNRYEAIPLF